MTDSQKFHSWVPSNWTTFYNNSIYSDIHSSTSQRGIKEAHFTHKLFKTDAFCESYRIMLTGSLTRSYHEVRHCIKFWHIIEVGNEFENVLMVISMEHSLFYWDYFKYGFLLCRAHRRMYSVPNILEYINLLCFRCYCFWIYPTSAASWLLRLCLSFPTAQARPPHWNLLKITAKHSLGVAPGWNSVVRSASLLTGELWTKVQSSI